MGKTYKKRKNSKKEYYSLCERDILWEEFDEMRDNVDKMWDNLKENEKEEISFISKEFLNKN